MPGNPFALHSASTFCFSCGDACLHCSCCCCCLSSTHLASWQPPSKVMAPRSPRDPHFFISASICSFPGHCWYPLNGLETSLPNWHENCSHPEGSFLKTGTPFWSTHFNLTSCDISGQVLWVSQATLTKPLS